MSESQTTNDHKTIKKLAEERDGVPVTVKATETKGHAGILRIDFGPKEEALEEISWDEFFKKFNEAASPFCTRIRPRTAKSAAFTSL
jgi:hypothetical protein